MCFQIDVNFGVTKCWVRIPHTRHHLLVHEFWRNLSDEVNGPAGVGLLGVGHETEASRVLRVPGLAGVSFLVLQVGRLHLKYRDDIRPIFEKKYFVTMFSY